MKNLKLFLAAMLCAAVSFAQVETWSDDFEAYSPGNYLGVVGASVGWTTWSGATGGAEDVQVTDVDASSGDNSIYFEGEENGGPQDVVLDFGAEYDYGTFTYSMKVKADSGFYFNLQADATIGSTWALDFEATKDSLYVYNYVNSTFFFHAIVPYVHNNSWTEIAIHANLDSNEWKVAWAGDTIATFENISSNQIASADLFPLGPEYDFYVDDVSWTWDTVVVEPVGPDTQEVVIDGQTIYIVDGDSFELWDGNFVPLNVKELTTVSLEVYPNPAQDAVNVTFSSYVEDAMITILDLRGNVVMQPSKHFSGSQLQIDVRKLPSGVYTLNGITNQNDFTHTLVVEH